MARGDLELVVVKLERGRSDVDPEVRRRIPVQDPDGRVQREHVCRHPGVVITRLEVEVLEHYALPIANQLTLSSTPLDLINHFISRDESKRNHDNCFIK